jgi:acyl dehydratase
MGGIIAPPTFVDRFTPFYVLDDDNVQGYLGEPMPTRGIFKHGFSAGDEYESFVPVRPGDVITSTTTLADMYEKQGRPGIGRMLFSRFDKAYRNQRNQVVSVCRWTSVGYEGPAEGEESAGQRQPTEAQKPAADDVTPTILKWDDQWVTQPYFEDVTEGYELMPLARLQTRKRFVRYAQASNDLSDIHFDYDLVTKRGLPDVVAQGALTGAYIASMVTNWATPEGFLSKLSVQYRGYSVPGDVITTRGVVTGTRQQEGKNIVDCEVWAETQTGHRVTTGRAEVSLPSRKA